MASVGRKSMSDSQLSAYAMPEWSSPQKIEHSLAAIRDCTDQADSTAAYHRLLYAVGNDHAGIYYPVAVPVVRRLGEMLTTDNMWARRATLDALVDLSYSFAPSPGHYAMMLPDGSSVDTEHALRAAISNMRDKLSTLASSRASGTDERSLASEILEWIDGK
jgi:hypothetical protein